MPMAGQRRRRRRPTEPPPPSRLRGTLPRTRLRTRIYDDGTCRRACYDFGQLMDRGDLSAMGYVEGSLLVGNLSGKMVFVEIGILGRIELIER